MLNAGFKKKEDGLREELAAACDAAATARDAAEAAAARLTSAEEVHCRGRWCICCADLEQCPYEIICISIRSAGASYSLYRGACMHACMHEFRRCHVRRCHVRRCHVRNWQGQVVLGAESHASIATHHVSLAGVHCQRNSCGTSLL